MIQIQSKTQLACSLFVQLCKSPWIEQLMSSTVSPTHELLQSTTIPSCSGSTQKTTACMLQRISCICSSANHCPAEKSLEKNRGCWCYSVLVEEFVSGFSACTLSRATSSEKTIASPNYTVTQHSSPDAQCPNRTSGCEMAPSSCAGNLHTTRA